jgi:hypothetical protein
MTKWKMFDIEKEIADVLFNYVPDRYEEPREHTDILQERVALYPRCRCLLCTNFEIKHRAYCKIAKSMPGCGRNFNPRGGGSAVLV